MKTEDLIGRAAVVTGAGSGIGKSIALTLARKGMNIIVADINLDAAQTTVAEATELGIQAYAVRTDVSKRNDVEALADTAYAKFDDIAILVNNAGVSWRPFRASWDADPVDFEWMMNVNFWGVFNGHHAFIPRMMSTPGPKHIVNTSSGVTHVATPGHSAYTVAKAAVDGLSNTVRAEFQAAGIDIGLSILYPGAVATNISNSETLRPESDRTENRGIKPWTDYVPANAARTGADGKEIIADISDVKHGGQAIPADWVGPMVWDGILENRPFISTHPFMSIAGERWAQLGASYRP